MASTTVLGFVGLGVMGEPMCKNLAAKSGARVVAFDARPAPLDALAAHGVERAASVADVAAQAEIVFVCLPGEPEVRAVCLGAGGLIARLDAGRTLVDMSTVPVALARELDAAAARARRDVRGCARGPDGAGGRGRHAVDHGRRRAGAFRAAPPLSRVHGQRDHALRRRWARARRSSS